MPALLASAPGTTALTQPANELVADRPTSLSRTWDFVQCGEVAPLRQALHIQIDNILSHFACTLLRASQGAAVGCKLRFATFTLVSYFINTTSDCPQISLATTQADSSVFAAFAPSSFWHWVVHQNGSFHCLIDSRQSLWARKVLHPSTCGSFDECCH